MDVHLDEERGAKAPDGHNHPLNLNPVQRRFRWPMVGCLVSEGHCATDGVVVALTHQIFS
jgi:hypothetical protein